LERDILIKYHSVVLMCKDLQKSRDFYQNLFGLKIELEIDGLVTFTEGISLWQQSIASQLLYNGEDLSSPPKNPGQELYFETDDIDKFAVEILPKSVRLLHPVQPTPWQQRTVRFFDPDDHLIEVGESMEEVIRRINREGHTADQIAEMTFMPVDIVRAVLNPEGI
jgi:catechol 2,3-dioxygenase-like lactoylglutathione lyase family enzyme